jgi:hypothetical protein
MQADPPAAGGADLPAAVPATVPVPPDAAALPAAGTASLPVAGSVVLPAAGTASADLSADGEPPPLYATRMPPPVRLRYALRHNGRSADALLDWQHYGSRYRLTLRAAAPQADAATDPAAPAGPVDPSEPAEPPIGGGSGVREGLPGLPAPARPRALLAQVSSGMLDADGLAPERFVDRRAAGAPRAVNFRRDIGRIGYSGPSHLHPAWPGAQDRLSWLAQLVAILAASPVPPLVVTLFVADATGQAGPWHLQRQPDATGPTPWGAQPLQHWRREAPRPEALQVDVWLALPGALPGGPPATGGWPLRLRFTVPRSGDVLELVLLAPA